MCILFLIIGDDRSPTVICNNRDEYLARSTVRGCLIENGNTYCPVDQVGGGSWLSFSGLKENRLKFAVVLNYHYWRQANVLPITNEEELKSRGLLIKNFMEGTLDSLSYAKIVHETRAEYRPFNLVVGDHTGCYYVTRDLRQSNPFLLERGKAYGLSNGYIEDLWQKVMTGVNILNRTILPSYLPSLSQSKDSIKAFADSLMSCLLQVDTPLDDPDLGSQSEAITILGAIFVKPCLILKKKQAPTATVASSATSSESKTTNASSGETGEGDVSWDEATMQRLFNQRSEAVLKACHVLPEGYTLCEAPTKYSNSNVPRDCIFCTRTSTVFIYCPAAMYESIAVDGVEKDIGSGTENGRSLNEVSNVFRAAKNIKAPNHYVIIENDLDAATGKWTSNTFAQ